jgi:hypothetical protein
MQFTGARLAYHVGTGLAVGSCLILALRESLALQNCKLTSTGRAPEPEHRKTAGGAAD